MGSQKDHPRVIEFMRLFHELSDWTGDAAHLKVRVANEAGLKELCHKIDFASLALTIDERQHRALFRQPVNCSFLEAWRRYQEDWESIVSDIVWSDICDGTVGDSPDDQNDPFTRRWEFADEEAEKVVSGFDSAIEQASKSVEFGDFPEGYAESIDEAIHEYRLLPKRVGFDLKGILRRRSLVPVILIPRHVAERHGETRGPYPDKKLPLWLQLQQAQEAFIFGLPLAAIPQVRALTELVLTYHYGCEENKLNDKLKNHKLKKIIASNLIDRLVNLCLLANDSLHYGESKPRDQLGQQKRLDELAEYAASLADPEKSLTRNAAIAVERDLISYLNVLQKLVEKAPLKG